jgi:hypothetical protein
MAILSGNGFAGTTGKISGKATDKANREGLPGVNIILEGTRMGAVTDFDGNFTIINVPPGIYTVKASLVGYKEMIVRNVQVNIDLTARLDFVMEETTLELGETVTVVAERPLIQKDLTASTAVVGTDVIQSLPVTEVSEVLELQAGVVVGHVRGGRSGELAYWIDGVPVTDVYDGSTVIEVSKSTVQELQLVSGAFNAEFGQAMSGVINVVTKDGSDRFTGEFTGYLGDYVSDEDREVDPQTGAVSTLFDGIDEIDPTAIRNVEASLSGPILRDKLYFFTNARFIHFDGWLYGRDVYKPENITDNRAPDPAEWIISTSAAGRGDSSLVPMNDSEKIYLQGKLTYRLTPTVRLSYNAIRDAVEYKDFDFGAKFVPAGIPQRFRTGTTHLFNVNHAINNRTFYQAGVSYFIKDYRQYVYENRHDSRYVHPLLLGQNPPYSFRTGGVDLKHFTRTTRTYVGKLDLTSQISKTHEIKAGFEVRQHNIYFEDIDLVPGPADAIRTPAMDGNPFISTVVAPAFSTATDRYRHKPFEASAYLQDKMEFRDMIVNIGLRFDVFDADGVVLADPSDPNVYFPLRPGNRFNDANGNGIQDAGEADKTVAEREAYWYNKASVKTQFSPRLGVAFPVSERGAFHFSYGYFFQIPAFDLLYQNPEFELGAGTGNLGIIGNADLKPQQTVNGEVGLQQQLSDDISIDLTGYFRDIRDLAGTRADEIGLFGAGKYNKYVNSDFGFVRGIVLSFEKRLANNFGATIDYTLQTAKGNASDPAQTRNAVAGGREPEVQLVPLDWDQTHTINATASYGTKSWGASLIMQYGSGLPYTPRQSADIGVLLLNSERRPDFFNVDLRAYKDFQFDRLRFSLFGRVFNLFDIRNQTGVFDDTGRADFTLDELLARLQNPPLLVNSLRQIFRNPTFYSEPRRLELGLTITY